jgi:Trypsin-like peptidase domain
VSIWEETDVDWSTGAGLSVAQLFERAYDDRAAARGVAAAAGVAWPPTASTLSHSELWAALLTSAARDRKVPALAAELLDDPKRTLFTDPLIRALGDQRGLANAVSVAKRGFPQSQEEKSAVVESMDMATMTAVILPPAEEGQLEAVNNAVDRSVSGLAYAQSLMNALRRVGLVRRGHSEVGSGFLVGPDLLLTAAHVIWPKGRELLPSDIDTVEVVMDFNERGQAVAETGTPARVKEVLRASPATEQELGPPPLVNWDAPDDHLDYALLRLDRAVGNDETPETEGKTRGWYRLSPIEPDLSRSELVLVWHFPEGKFLRCSVMKGSFQYNPAGTKTRLRYRSDTRPGSSGGPIIDEQGRLLAIHHYGLQPANQAVPIWRIAGAVEDLVGPVAAVEHKPLVTVSAASEALLVTNRPVVNRKPLWGKLWGAMTTANAARSLMIVGTVDTGVSWSYLLLDHLAAESWRNEELKANAPHGIKALKIDLRDDIAGPVAERRAALIRAVSVALASETITDDWPAQAARQISDFKEWCRRKLPVDGPQWWIFIDSIDETGDLEQHAIGEVLKALVDLAYESQVNLRLVLAGRKADKVDHGSLAFGARDDTVGLTRQEVKTWVQSMAERDGRAVDDTRLERFLDSWFPSPDQTDRPVQLTLALLAAVEQVSA